MGSGSECRTETVWASCLSNVLRLSWRWLKRAPQREGQVSASGLAVDHSKDDTMSSSQIGSGLVSNLRIIAGAVVTPSLPFICVLWWSIHKCAASSQLSALLFFHPTSLHTQLQPPWASADAGGELRNQCKESGLGQFGGRLVWIIHSPGETVASVVTEVYYRQGIPRLYHITTLISET